MESIRIDRQNEVTSRNHKRRAEPVKEASSGKEFIAGLAELRNAKEQEKGQNNASEHPGTAAEEIKRLSANPVHQETTTNPTGLESDPAKLFGFGNTQPGNVKITETYSCDRKYEYKLDNGKTWTLDIFPGDARKIKVNGTSYKATYSTNPEKAGEFIGYYTEDGKEKFAPKVLYGYAWNYFSSDETFNKNLGAAFQNWFDNPKNYGWEDSQGNLNEAAENYNCFEFALALTSLNAVDYNNIMSQGVADNSLTNNYKNVPTSQMIPGQTLIRFSANNGGENRADHMAIYLGKNSKGQTIIATKNAKSVQPKIMLLKDLLIQQWQFGSPVAMDGDKTPYYNPY